MKESFFIEVEKRKIESEVDLCIIYVTKKVKENLIKEPKFYQVLSRTYFHFRGKHTAMAILRWYNSSLEQNSGQEQILRTRKKNIIDSQNLLQWF